MSAVLKAVDTMSVTQLIERLIECKRDEEIAKNARILAEESLIEALAFAKPEGSETFKIGDYKVVATGKLTRSIDWDAYDKVAAKVPEALQPVKWERKLDEKGLKYLEQHEPKLYALVAKAVTVKPAKTAVTASRVA